jgi:hypothetical protein
LLLSSSFQVSRNFSSIKFVSLHNVRSAVNDPYEAQYRQLHGYDFEDGPVYRVTGPRGPYYSELVEERVDRTANAAAIGSAAAVRGDESAALPEQVTIGSVALPEQATIESVALPEQATSALAFMAPITSFSSAALPRLCDFLDLRFLCMCDNLLVVHLNQMQICDACSLGMLPNLYDLALVDCTYGPTFNPAFETDGPSHTATDMISEVAHMRSLFR